jgi:hypothetical protein
MPGLGHERSAATNRAGHLGMTDCPVLVSASQCSDRQSAGFALPGAAGRSIRARLGKFSKHPSARATELYVFVCGVPVRGVSLRHVTSPVHYVGLRGVSRGASSTPLIRQVRPMDHGTATGWGGDLPPMPRSAEASTQNDGQKTLGTGAQAVPGSATGLRPAPVSARRTSITSATAEPEPATARQHLRRFRPTVGWRPRSPRKGAWRDPDPS